MGLDPTVSGDDPAIWARLRVVPFDVVIPKAEQDKTLAQSLEVSADAVLAWAIEGWTSYREIGLAEPAAVLEATAAYESESDALGRWIAEECVTSAAVKFNSGKLYEAWSRWAHQEGAEPGGKNMFSHTLDRRGFTAYKGSGGVRFRRGIALRASNAED